MTRQRRRVRVDVERLTNAVAMLARLLRVAAAALVEVATVLDRIVAAAGFPVAVPEAPPAGRVESAATVPEGRPPTPEAQAGPSLRVVADPHDEVRQALVALGYPARQARTLVEGLPLEGTVEDLLREALRRAA